MMANPPRKIGFVLAATEHGTMILNRFDYHRGDNGTYGLGHVLLSNSIWQPAEIGGAVSLLAARRRHFGDGVMAIDCGANIGTHTLEWARSMTGWGSVIAIEAQERIFYALAGNIALNNCFNARAIFAAVAATDGILRVPTPDYLAPGSFGSLELKHSATNEFIGQKIDYAEAKLTAIRSLAIDSLDLARVDLIKIDVEGMEPEVLEGARQTIGRCRPIILVEHLKAGRDTLIAALTRLGYHPHYQGPSLLAVHPTDPSIAQPGVGRGGSLTLLRDTCGGPCRCDMPSLRVPEELRTVLPTPGVADNLPDVTRPV
jgi:FkbM family methyltransferase